MTWCQVWILPGCCPSPSLQSSCTSRGFGWWWRARDVGDVTTVGSVHWWWRPRLRISHAACCVYRVNIKTWIAHYKSKSITTRFTHLSRVTSPRNKTTEPHSKPTAIRLRFSWTERHDTWRRWAVPKHRLKAWHRCGGVEHIRVKVCCRESHARFESRSEILLCRPTIRIILNKKLKTVLNILIWITLAFPLPCPKATL